MTSDDLDHNAVSRRQFLGRSAQRAAGVAAGVVGLTAATSALAAGHSANDRVTVGVIGVRNQGKLLTSELAKLGDVEIRSLCDIDESQFAPAIHAAIEFGQKVPSVERDFRRLMDDPAIDAVVIATPDHWHAEMTKLACQAGKDVYVESPSTHFVAEGLEMLAAAQRENRIVQVGLQQRSGSHFISAIDFLRSGRLGQVKLAKAWIVQRGLRAVARFRIGSSVQSESLSLQLALVLGLRRGRIGSLGCSHAGRRPLGTRRGSALPYLRRRWQVHV